MTGEWLSQYIGQLDEVRLDLAHQVRELNDDLRSRRVSRTDRNDLVAVTATGLGQVLGIDFHPSAQRYPQRIGEAVTAAVASTRQAARELQSQRSETLLPATGFHRPPAEPTEAWPRIDFNAVVFSDDPGARRRLAQAVDSFNKLQEIQERCRTTVTARKIGRGAGSVSIRGYDGDITVEIARTALGDLGGTRLGEQIVTAIEEATTAAAAAYQRELNELPVGNSTLGESLDHASEQVSD
jgi:DNA-binding protein YbaB